jgi:hypothetical protein
MFLKKTKGGKIKNLRKHSSKQLSYHMFASLMIKAKLAFNYLKKNVYIRP